MKPKRGITGPFTFKLARYIGRRDFPKAIEYLDDYLRAYPNEVAAWICLAQCHLWSGSDTKAIEAASMALRCDANDFEALRLLGEIYATRNEHDKAVDFVRRGLANFPEPFAPLSPRVRKTFRFIAPLLPKRLRSIESDLAAFEDPGAKDRKWFSWAKEYLAWYDHATGGSSAPIVH